MPAETPRRRRPGRLGRLGRALGDAFLLAGIGRGLIHGSGRHNNPDHLLARAALFDEAAQDRHAPDEVERPTGLLEHVPGWILLVALGAVFLFALFVWRPI